MGRNWTEQGENLTDDNILFYKFYSTAFYFMPMLSKNCRKRSWMLVFTIFERLGKCGVGIHVAICIICSGNVMV